MAEVKKASFFVYDLAAFKVPEHRSVCYDMFLSRDQLHKALDKALDKGANVISIRLVEGKKGP